MGITPSIPPPDPAIDARDRELLAETAAGDLDAWAELCLRLGPMLAIWFGKNLDQRFASDIEDRVAEVDSRIRKRAATYRGDSKVSTWVIGIAQRVTQEHLRAVKRREEALRSLADSSAAGPTPDADTPENRAKAALLTQAIEQLPAAERAAVRRETDGRSNPREGLHGAAADRHRQNWSRGRRRLLKMITNNEEYALLRTGWKP